MAKFTFDTTALKRQVEENPLVAATIGAGLLTAFSKLLDANTRRKNSKTWSREVERRRKR
jgi:hypothetical protein